MPNLELTKLRKDFDTAITSTRTEALDPLIAEMRENVSQTDFVESCSIYSRGQLRKMNHWLGRISNARLKENPMEVAIAVGAVRQLLDELEITMRQSAESKMLADFRISPFLDLTLRQTRVRKALQSGH